jgi:hypothetical protein
MTEPTRTPDPDNLPVEESSREQRVEEVSEKVQQYPAPGDTDTDDEQPDDGDQDDDESGDDADVVPGFRDTGAHERPDPAEDPS